MFTSSLAAQKLAWHDGIPATHGKIIVLMPASVEPKPQLPTPSKPTHYPQRPPPLRLFLHPRPLHHPRQPVSPSPPPPPVSNTPSTQGTVPHHLPPPHQAATPTSSPPSLSPPPPSSSSTLYSAPSPDSAYTSARRVPLRRGGACAPANRCTLPGRRAARGR